MPITRARTAALMNVTFSEESIGCSTDLFWAVVSSLFILFKLDAECEQLIFTSEEIHHPDWYPHREKLCEAIRVLLGELTERAEAMPTREESKLTVKGEGRN